MKLRLLALAMCLVPMTSGAEPEAITTGAGPERGSTRAVTHVESADRILVDKSARLLQLVRGRRVLKTYRIALGAHPTGPKRRQGDQRTPEGIYHIDGRNPGSRFHLSLRISYPNAQDRARAAARGVDPGGDIMIHGLGHERAEWGAEHRLHDWTDGCIAVTDREIREIWALVPVGTYVEIRP